MLQKQLKNEEHRELRFMASETSLISCYCLFKSIYSLHTTEISFLLFQWPMYLAQVILIYLLHIKTSTNLISLASYCFLFDLLPHHCKFKLSHQDCTDDSLEHLKITEYTKAMTWLLSQRQKNVTLQYSFQLSSPLFHQ